ncbi:MAG: TIGR03013 family PEP-CTERM/XrtA system glycosyltransferase [Methylococcaceae bacterium]|nr:TIGR03013 family PEP-CTERM/XrtA system glycosyltransferase [Methylococcaceae bacterium]
MTLKIFSHHISWVYLLLFVTELLIFFSSMFFADRIRFMFSPNWYTQEYRLFTSMFFAVMLSCAAFGLGLYRRSLSWSERGLLTRVVISFVAALGLVSFFLLLIPNFTISKGVLAIALSSAFLGMICTRFLFYKLTKHNIFIKNILVIGGGKAAQKIIDSNAGYIHRGFQVLGCIVFPGEQVIIKPSLIMDNSKSILELITQYRIDEIVITIDDRRGILPIKDLLDCKMVGVTISDLRSFYEREKALIYLENLIPSWFVFSEGFANGGTLVVLKRFFDLLASLILLLITWPVMLLTILAIALESGFDAPVFYRQTRVGENDKYFDVIKFRSMRVDAEKNGAQWAEEADDRITRVGRFIRKYRIDELPQILNVLKGEMSFVGPRPERPEFVKQFNQSIPFYNERHRVKPGITGWAQLCYPYGSNEYDALQKLQYDLYYIKNISIFLDLTIIIHTVEIILWGKGSR